MVAVVARRPAFVLGLALLAGACAADGSNLLNPDDLYKAYDSNGDNELSPQEWDDAFWKLDTNGDGIVSRDEFDAGFGGGP